MTHAWNVAEFFSGLCCDLGPFSLIKVEQDPGNENEFTCIFEPVQIEGMTDNPEEFRQQVYAIWHPERSILSFWISTESGIPPTRYEWAVHAVNTIFNNLISPHPVSSRE